MLKLEVRWWILKTFDWAARYTVNLNQGLFWGIVCNFKPRKSHLKLNEHGLYQKFIIFIWDWCNSSQEKLVQLKIINTVPMKGVSLWWGTVGGCHGYVRAMATHLLCIWKWSTDYQTITKQLLSIDWKFITLLFQIDIEIAYLACM